MKKKKSLSAKVATTTTYRVKTDSKGKLIMICQNSEPGGKYWKGALCNNYEHIGSPLVEAVLCWKCTAELADPPYVHVAAVKSDKPKGWKFMKIFVDKDGNVFHKGIEQPELKGTLPVTVIEPKPERKKLTKQEKESEIQQLGKDIAAFKAQLFTNITKGQRIIINRSLTKANRQLKKLL